MVLLDSWNLGAIGLGIVGLCIAWWWDRPSHSRTEEVRKAAGSGRQHGRRAAGPCFRP